ncbi:MAG: radical SAM protein, partial [Candidatus Omnitrophica bacterium]|nr:radical SAM protein [Candidatus Omnitrophota bacterium]
YVNSMKILLVRTWENKKSYRCYETNITGIYPPLGIAYLASVLRESGHKVRIIDNQILRLNQKYLKARIKEIQPDLVLISSMTTSWPEALRLSRLIKEISAKITVGVGGPHIGLYPQESLKWESIDFGVLGEGEQAILEIVISLERNKSLKDISGCAYKDNGQVLINPPRPAIVDLDTIPFPAIDLLPHKRYFSSMMKGPVFSIITARGCPFNCNFCYRDHLGYYRTRSAENVVEEIEILTAKYGIKDMVFFDETFAAEEERTLKICDLIRRKNIKFNWDIRTRIDLMNENILKNLKSAGCSRIHIGVESGSQRILDNMGKRVAIEDASKKIGYAKKFGFEVRGYFMLAYPGEEYDDLLQTLSFANSMPLDWASFTVTIGLPGTNIYRDAVKTGYFSTDCWKEYTEGKIPYPKPYFLPDGLDIRDVFSFKRKAYLRFYMRPKKLFNIVSKLKTIDLLNNGSIFIRTVPAMGRSIFSIPEN